MELFSIKKLDMTSVLPDFSTKKPPTVGFFIITDIDFQFFATRMGGEGNTDNTLRSFMSDMQ